LKDREVSCADPFHRESSEFFAEIGRVFEPWEKACRFRDAGKRPIDASERCRDGQGRSGFIDTVNGTKVQ